MGTREHVPNCPTPFHRGGIQRLLVVITIASVVWISLRPRIHETTTIPRGVTSPLLRVNLNDADERELSLLPSIGPTIARRIIENRDRLGPFESLEDLGRIHGIGEKSIEKLRVYCHFDETTQAVAMAQTP